MPPHTQARSLKRATLIASNPPAHHSPPEPASCPAHPAPSPATRKPPPAPPLPPPPKQSVGPTRRPLPPPPPPPPHATPAARSPAPPTCKPPPPAPPPLPPVKQASGSHRKTPPPPPPPPPYKPARPASPALRSSRRIHSQTVTRIPRPPLRSRPLSRTRMQSGNGTLNHGLHRSRLRPRAGGVRNNKNSNNNISNKNNNNNNKLPRGELQARYRRRLQHLVNAERARHGAPPVELDETLTACARSHNADLAFVQKQLSHVGFDGADLSQRLHRCGYSYRYASENVARGQGDPAHVVRSWMKSPGHRKNLISPRVTHMGVHVGRGEDGRLYWAQMFGIEKAKLNLM